MTVCARLLCALNVPSINNKSLNKIRWDAFDIVKLQRCGQICMLKWTKRITSIHVHISMLLHFDECDVDEMCDATSCRVWITYQNAVKRIYDRYCVCTTNALINDSSFLMALTRIESFHWLKMCCPLSCGLSVFRTFGWCKSFDVLVHTESTFHSNLFCMMHMRLYQLYSFGNSRNISIQLS